MRAANTIIFQKINQGFKIAISIGVISINCYNEWSNIFI